MKNLIGNTNNLIDWQNVIDNLGSGKIKSVSLSDHIDGNKGFDSIFTIWKNAGYNDSSIYWTNYYVGENYDSSVDEIFSKFVGMPCLKSWISMIQPGKCAPIHQDVDDHMDEYLTKGTPVRFSCHIGEPEIGHVFILEDEIFHCETRGNAYRWNDCMLTHAGGNVGWKPKYLYNFIGCSNV